MEDVEHTQISAVVWLVIAAVLGLILYITNVYQKKERKNKGQGAGSEVRARPAASVRGEGPPAARTRNARQRMHAQRNRQTVEESQESSDDEVVPGVDVKDDTLSGKVGAKKMKRLQQKAEKKAEREQMEQEREERKKQEKLREEERKKEEEMNKLELERQAEEERLKKEEQERKEHEEYLMLKDSFVVEEEGEMATETEEETQSRLKEFVNYVKDMKVVMLEDLASQFSLRVQEAIDRLTKLQEMGMITGVMDDRGKFIYISEEELTNVSKFIKRRGRVAISELAECSNKLIGMKGQKPTIKREEPSNMPVDVSA